MFININHGSVGRATVLCSVHSEVAAATPTTGSSGHLVYAAGGALRAMPFDLARLETREPSVTVVPDVVTTFNGGVDAVVAANGTLAPA
jgi:hypothetical protein